MNIEEYTAPVCYRTSHIGTIFPSLFRTLAPLRSSRETVTLEDGRDFVDVDIVSSNSANAVLLVHGLEGSSQSQYMVGMAHALKNHGFDVLLMNHRGCSGRPNNLARSYHSGATEDVSEVLNHFSGRYQQIDLVGFSLGGNVALKLAAETPQRRIVTKVVGISVPIDLAGCADELGRPRNFVYLFRFLRSLKLKALRKADLFPDAQLDVMKIKSSRNFFDFDNSFTAPIHGFSSANDYYHQCSSLFDLEKIPNKTLIINACNDSFLSKSCYPTVNNKHITAIYPKHGGHVGFASNHRMTAPFWTEKLTCSFLRNS